MRRKIKGGTTSVTVPILVQDTSSTTGAGLGGLVFNTANLVCEYRRQGAATWTAVTLLSGTLGTWSAGGFVADGSLNGAYEVGIPDAALAAGARWVVIRLYGAANMLVVPIEIELDAVDYQDANGFGLARLDQTIGSRLASTSYVVAPSAGTVAAAVWEEPIGSHTTTGSYGVGVNLNLAQVVPATDLTSKTIQTTGDCLSAARADGAGKWVFVGTTETVFGPNNETVRTFTLNDASTPTQRA